MVTISMASCHKDYSSEGKPFVLIDSLPDSYPFATGFCDGVVLGIDIPDTNYYIPETSAPLPETVSLNMPIPGDQQRKGSCTAWSVVYAAGSYCMHMKLNKPYSDTGNLSPDFTYNQITKGNCICTSILDNLYLLKTQGAASLNSMPYDPFVCSKQPDSSQRNNAANFKINDWRKLNSNNINYIKRAIAERHPIIFAINLDDGFYRLKSPFLWKERNGSLGGGHVMTIVGYDNSLNAFRVMNSWSPVWADNGFAWIDYDFFLKNAFESRYIVI